MTDRPNFFDLLELDPGETSWEVIVQRIDKKKEAWSRDRTMGHPGKRLEAQRNFELLPEIRRVLEDPALREREAEDARTRCRKARETELTEQIELFKATGTCRKEDFGKLVERFAGVFSEAELRGRLQAVGIRVEEAKSTPPRERIPGDLARTIRQNLDALRLNTLYDFLGLAPSCSPEALCALAEEILKKNQHSGRTTADVTASNKLAGICKTLFSTAEEKRKYDTHWVLEVLEGLRDRLGLADRTLSREELETLIRLAEQRGVPAGETREFFASQIDPQRSAPQPAAPKPPEPSRKLGGLPVRRMAAAAALLLALGGGGAAVFYWPAPAKLLASLLPAAGPSPQRKSQVVPNPGPSGGAGGQASGGRNAPPQSPNQVSPVSPNPVPAQAAAGTFPLPAAPWQTNTNPGQIAGSPGQSGQTGGVLGQATSRPAPAVVPPQPSQPALALPETPEITVLAVGDPLLATAVEDELEQAFRSEGFTVASGLASLDGFRQHRTDKPSVSQVFSALQGDGVHVLILARVDLLAERELSYYGRKDVASTSRLRIDAYLMDGRRSLDNWSDQVEYTAVNAAIEGEAAARRAASDLFAAIHDGWSSHRGTGSTQ
jgi:hypothetical protein